MLPVFVYCTVCHGNLVMCRKSFQRVLKKQGMDFMLETKVTGVCLCAHVYVCLCAHVYVCQCAHVYVCLCVYMYACVHVLCSVCACACVCIVVYSTHMLVYVVYT